MSERVRAPLIALAVSAGLIAAYLAFGGASYQPAQVAYPCLTRDSALLEQRGLFEAIALSSLDGAACELRVSREELTLALADEASTEAFASIHGIDSDEVEQAVRAGLIRAVDDQVAAGRIDGIEETVLRGIATNAPVGAAITALQALPGDDSLPALLQRLGALSDFSLPGLEELPSLNDLNDLIP